MASLAEKFARADAKTRIFVILGVIVGVVVAIIVGSKFFGGTKTAGNARVAGAPSLQSVPGGQLTPEYYRALMQANQQNAQQAQVSGGSAVPTLVNAPTQDTTPAPAGNCTVMCPGDEQADVGNELNDLVKAGKLSQADANQLQAMAKANVPVSEYSSYLANLVKQGKISPEEARKLLSIYQKQHDNAEVAGSAQTMDALIKSGRLPIEAATALLDLQKKHASIQDYSNALNDLVRQGKISPETAALLLAQYTQQQAHKASDEAASNIRAMAASGQISPETANDLLALQKRNVPVADYKAELDRLVAAGKMTPETAAKLLADYQKARTETGPADTLNGIVADAEADSAADVNNLLAAGKLSPQDAGTLLNLQKSHASAQDYANAVDQLVKEGKLTPEEAAKLKADYARTSAADVGNLVASGKISAATADAISDLANRHVSPQEYAAALDQMVAQGKISAADAARLKAEYTSGGGPGGLGGGPGGGPGGVVTGAASTADDINNLVASGKISAGTAAALTELANRHLSPEQYAASVDQMVAEGKISAADAARLKADYNSEGAAAENAADISSLVGQGKLTQEDAANLMGLQKQQASPEEYAAAIDKLVKEGKLTPAEAERLKAKYGKLVALRTVASRLNALQANNASPTDYNNELSRAVQDKILTPEQAATLMSQYQALSARVPTAAAIAPTAGTNPTATGPGGGNFSVLQQRLAAQAGGGGGQVTVVAPGAPAGPDQAAQYAAAEAQAEADAAKQRQQEIQNLMSQMSGQAQALIASWEPTTMGVKTGNAEKKTTTTTTTTQTGNGRQTGGNTKNGQQEATGPPLIKAGTILFAVLTTAVDSDYPDTPVMATIVSGQFKGAVVLGKLALAQGQDKVSLNFTLMNRDDWDKGKNITAFAIDPDTARTVMASNVNYHYMLRYGTMFASSFVTGYANGISQSGSTTSSGIFGTTNTHPELSPGEKIAVALGQVGTTFGTALANYVNTPTTVKVNSGVGLGILFMADVT